MTWSASLLDGSTDSSSLQCLSIDSVNSRPLKCSTAVSKRQRVDSQRSGYAGHRLLAPLVCWQPIASSG